MTADAGPTRQERPSAADRIAHGKRARRAAPLESHEQLERTGVDPVDVLTAQAATRVPDLVPIRHGRMLTSPFAFFRGAAAVMAADLASTPTSGFDAQLCGDAHLSNFGLYRAPDRRMVFDINDFDETLPGPWEWDVKRLVASMVVASRENGHDDAETDAIALATGAAYREAMRTFAGRTNLAVWYARVDVEDLLAERRSVLSARQARGTRDLISKAERRDHLSASRKLTHVVDGRRRLISDPPLLVPVEDLDPTRHESQIAADLRHVLDGYSASLAPDRRVLLDQYEVVHLARKVVGVGSVGTRAFVVLLAGRDDTDLLLLQAKEAQASVLATHLGPAGDLTQGHRVVAGQHLMQAASDIFLGSLSVTGTDGAVRDFFVRQLRDGKGSVPVGELAPRGLTVYGRLCAWTLARAHARSGDRLAIAGYLGKSERFERALVGFARAYADLNAADHAALQGAVRTGRLTAVDA